MLPFIRLLVTAARQAHHSVGLSRPRGQESTAPLRDHTGPLKFLRRAPGPDPQQAVDGSMGWARTPANTGPLRVPSVHTMPTALARFNPFTSSIAATLCINLGPQEEKQRGWEVGTRLQEGTVIEGHGGGTQGYGQLRVGPQEPQGKNQGHSSRKHRCPPKAEVRTAH